MSHCKFSNINRFLQYQPIRIREPLDSRTVSQAYRGLPQVYNEVDCKAPSSTRKTWLLPDSVRVIVAILIFVLILILILIEELKIPISAQNRLFDIGLHQCRAKDGLRSSIVKNKVMKRSNQPKRCIAFCIECHRFVQMPGEGNDHLPVSIPDSPCNSLVPSHAPEIPSLNHQHRAKREQK